MAWRAGSLPRTLMSAARTSSRSSSSTLPRLHRPVPPTVRSHHIQPRRSLFTVSRNVAQLGCLQSLMPLHSAVASSRLTSHISVESRACCELSQGT